MTPPHPSVAHRLRIFLIAFLGTFAVVRFAMVLRPNADLHVAGYNVHHLFTGLLLLTACVVPLILDAGGRLTRGLIAGSGVGLALGLDEVAYLIATDGSNAAYLTRVSWMGALILLVACSIYAIAVGHRASRDWHSRALRSTQEHST